MRVCRTNGAQDTTLFSNLYSQFVDRLCGEGMLAFRRLPGSRHRGVLVADVLAVAAERDRRREGAAAIRSALEQPS